MRVKVTKTMADYINTLAKKGMFNIENAKVVEISDDSYAFNVGDIFDAQDYGDYVPSKDKYKALMIIYPYEYYACPLFITTKRLLEKFKANKVKTLDEFNEMLKDMIEI